MAHEDLMKKTKAYLVTLINEEVEQHAELQEAFKELKAELENEKAKQHTYIAKYNAKDKEANRLQEDCRKLKITLENVGHMFTSIASSDTVYFISENRY